MAQSMASPWLSPWLSQRSEITSDDLRPDHGGPPIAAMARQSAGPESSAMTPTREQILAVSAGWVAVVLNVIPGLGTGYLYQRRWKAYWITSALATAWFLAGALLAREADAAAEAQNQLVGLIGLLALAAVTATEAGLAVKKVRQSD